jgi:hypothetical protein
LYRFVGMKHSGDNFCNNFEGLISECFTPGLMRAIPANAIRAIRKVLGRILAVDRKLALAYIEVAQSNTFILVGDAHR